MAAVLSAATEVASAVANVEGVSTGVIYRGEREASIENEIQLPAYARWDAGLYYTQGRVTFSLIAENLLDTFYIASGKSEVANMRAKVSSWRE